MKTEHPLLTLSVLAAVNLSARRFATTGGAVPAAGAKVLGVVNADTDSGDRAGVGAIGVFLVESGGAIAADANCETDNQGRAITISSGANCGRILDAAAGAGEFVRVARGID